MKRIEPGETYEKPTRLASAPDLWVVDGVVTAREIALVLAFVGDEDNVRELAAHANVTSSGFAAEFEADCAPFLERLTDRFCEIVGVGSKLTPTLRFRYYGEGEGHPPHLDAYERQGHLLAVSALLFLSDTDAGGETTFPKARPEPIAVAPRAGRLIAWTNYLAGGRPDPASRHAGKPVLRGSKSVLLAFSYLPPAESAVRLAPAWPRPAPRPRPRARRRTRASA